VPADDDIVIPDYGGGCLSNVVPALLGRRDGVPAWVPSVVAGARQVVLFVLDGLGWEQFAAHRAALPHLGSMAGGRITSVVPSTTATALTSLALGRPPGEHGIVGYRMHVGDGKVLNVLRWRTAEGDARKSIAPGELQPEATFAGSAPVVVTRAEFEGTGFSAAHLRDTRLAGWYMPSSIAVEVGAALRNGDSLVYAYYDGIDKVAHAHGLEERYRAELVAADRLVGELIAALPPGAVLVVTSDHGQVDTRVGTVTLDAEVVAACAFLSGEARFRWLHAPPGGEAHLIELVRRRYGGEAIVRTRDEVERAGWLGPVVRTEVRARLGDVAVVATGPTAYLDPTDRGEPQLGSRHGALTAAEMWVPLLAAGP
jgi:hypothetical protein